MKSLFARLNEIDCSDHTEKKGKFTYLSWSWAWQTLKTECPDATFEKHEFAALNGLGQQDGTLVPFMRDDQGYTFVKVSVTAEGVTMTETFPVLDYTHKAIQNPDSFALNTALQRAMVKAIAMHGLGLYIYAGEDLPEITEETAKPEKKPKKPTKTEKAKVEAQIAKIGKEPEAGYEQSTIIKTGLENSIVSEKTLSSWLEKGISQADAEGKIQKILGQQTRDAVKNGS